MVKRHLDTSVVKVALDPVDIGIGTTPDLKTSISQSSHHLGQSRSGLEFLVFIHDVVNIFGREKVVKSFNGDASLEENSCESVGKNGEEGFVLFDLGKV